MIIDDGPAAIQSTYSKVSRVKRASDCGKSMGDIELHKLLISRDIKGVNVKDIDKKTGEKIKRGYKRYDEADVVYHELFRRDEHEVLMKVIRDKDENFKRKKDRNA